MLQHELPGIIQVNPQGGKVARAAAISLLIEAGNVYLPHPEWAPWVWEYIEECAAFPNRKHDDHVDTMTQAICIRWQSRSIARTRSVNRYGSVPYRDSSAVILRDRPLPRYENCLVRHIRGAA